MPKDDLIDANSTHHLLDVTLGDCEFESTLAPFISSHTHLESNSMDQSMNEVLGPNPNFVPDCQK